jgi:hypothetical protein
MPATPLHLGPGLLLKSVAGRHFSLSVFAFSQVVIDLEPAVRIVREDPILHGPTHTLLGATLIAILSVLVGKPACQWALGFWKRNPGEPFMGWLRGEERITWTAAATGAFVGTWSHVAFDSIMHWDMRPLWPWSDANALQHAISVDALQLACVAAGIAGAAILAALYRMRVVRQ